MEYPSPVFSPRYRNNQHGNNYQSPFSSPGGAKINFEGGSPDFIPFNYSSPLKRGGPRDRGHRRYFNTSNTSYSSSGSSFSPYNNKYNRSRGNYSRNSFGGSQNSNISLYYDPSMLEDPWAELETQLKNKKMIDTTETNKQEAEHGKDFTAV